MADLSIDPTQVKGAATQFRTLPGTLDVAQNPLNSLPDLKPGDFTEGKDLLTAVKTSVGDFSVLLDTLQTTFTDLSTSLDDAARILTDTEQDNDSTAGDGFVAIGQAHGAANG